MMTPLGSIFKSGTCKPPKIDEHGLFTSIQVSVPVLEGDLQVYEPWRRKRNRPKECRVTLYVNETSPFLVWCKLEKSRNLQTGSSGSAGEPLSSPTANKPRCVISVSRAKLAKTTGGSFELTDFASNLTFRFISRTIREAETWVEKLAEESLREANLDMRSICSSCSSFSSSTSSFSSPDASPNDSNVRFFPAPNTNNPGSKSNHRKSASFSDASGALIHLLNNGGTGIPLSPSPAIGRISEDTMDGGELESEVFAVKSTASHVAACKLGHIRSNSKTFPRAQATSRQKQQQHMRAQPHLGLNIVLDKHRPDLRSVIPDVELHTKPEHTNANRSKLPFSEYFVNVPSS
ncbi:unnamed protein product [Clavelina lepadiformis]|uniref:PH domain-containing protein n=1 Tax=Clavelina lepadiformis TaxID=159417 RepID=A0ABP0FWL2_CLALP